MNPYTYKPTLYERFIIWLNGCTETGELRETGNYPIMIYAFKCDTHGYVKNTPHGFYDKLTCPICERYRHIKEGEKRKH